MMATERNRSMAKLTTITLLALAVVFVFACTQSPSNTPTPDIDATIQAAVVASIPTPTPEPTPDVDATVSAAIEATKDAGRQTPTHTPQPTPTETPVPTSTNTPEPTPSETPEPTPTVAPTKTPVPTSTSTPTPVPTLILDSFSATRSSYGPEQGTLLHINDDWGNFDSEFDVANFIAEVTFTIPENLVGFGWVGCINFRSVLPVGWQPGDDFKGYHICINSLGTWFHLITREGTDQSDLIYENTTTTIRKQEGDINQIIVVISESSGILFINNIFVDELDLGELTSSGTVDIGAAAETGTSPTEFTNFKIVPLRKVYGPGVGEIEHHMQTTREIDGQSTFAFITDGIIEAQFVNPFIQQEGSWSNGFLFRQADYDHFHVIIASSSGWWYHGLRLGDPTNEKELAGEASGHISTERDGINRVRVVTLGDQGWLFINGEYVDQLDLSGLVDAGYVSAIGSYFQDDGIAGYSTRFEDFTIWSAD